MLILHSQINQLQLLELLGELIKFLQLRIPLKFVNTILSK